MDQIAARPEIPELRDRAHDIRNLFGAIASAGHLMAEAHDATRRTQLLDAIEQAALRGGALTTSLLASAPAPAAKRFEVGARLMHIEPLLLSLMRPGDQLGIDVNTGPALLRADTERFDHVAIELVTNARRAFAAEGRVDIRLRVRHGRIRLMIVDNGCGMSRSRARRLLRGTEAPGAHGTGFRQVRRFVGEMHGRLLVRSVPNRGTAVLVEMPALLGLAGRDQERRASRPVRQAVS